MGAKTRHIPTANISYHMVLNYRESHIMGSCQFSVGVYLGIVGGIFTARCGYNPPRRRAIFFVGARQLSTHPSFIVTISRHN